MEAMLQASVSKSACCNFKTGLRRIDAIKPACARGEPCRFDASLSAWSVDYVYKKLEKAHTRKFSDGRRAGSLGNWLRTADKLPEIHHLKS